MTAQLVLIAAILVLGGVIATVGDRLGMRVGKARLTLFNLRPRQTATIVTILTGSVISASTFALLFALSEQLRRGIFDYEEIQENLTTARQDLEAVSEEKQQIEAQRDEAIEQQRAARNRLRQINQNLEAAIARQARTAARLNQSQDQLNRTQNQLGRIRSSFERARAQLGRVTQQANSLRSEIRELQAGRQQLIRQREEELALRDQAIAEREALLRQLEAQRAFLAQEVQSLEREFQGLRQGNVALLRNQALVSRAFRIVDPTVAPQVIYRLLLEANRIAVQEILPDADDLDQQVIDITNAEVERLVSQIRDGQEYVVRILSAGNYVVGEPCVVAGESCIQVFAAATPNQVVFLDGEIVATVSVDPSTATDEELLDRIRLLVAASQFRARQAGILLDMPQVADGRTQTLISFLRQVKQYNQPIEVQAIASDVTYTAGPVRLQLVAVQDGQILFGTGQSPALFAPQPNSPPASPEQSESDSNSSGRNDLERNNQDQPN
jgi:uncharacterized protein (DUF3084 family)